MGKFYGPIGYIEDVETSPDVHVEKPIERMYSGDLTKNNRRSQTGDKVNDDITISNSISVVVDPYAVSHFHAIRYVKWMGTAWKVTNVDLEYPRLILTLGGVYNGETC